MKFNKSLMDYDIGLWEDKFSLWEKYYSSQYRRKKSLWSFLFLHEFFFLYTEKFPQVLDVQAHQFPKITKILLAYVGILVNYQNVLVFGKLLDQRSKGWGCHLERIDVLCQFAKFKLINTCKSAWTAWRYSPLSRILVSLPFRSSRNGSKSRMSIFQRGQLQNKARSHKGFAKFFGWNRGWESAAERFVTRPDRGFRPKWMLQRILILALFIWRRFLQFIVFWLRFF